VIAQYLYIEVAIISTLLASGLTWLLRKKLRYIDELKLKILDQSQQHEKEIKNLKEKPSSPKPTPAIKKTKSFPTSFLGEIEKLKSMYKNAKKRIDSLKQSNREKRKLITAIEEKLKQLKISDEELQKTIDALTLQLKDSEMCTATLELETDSLREKISTISDDTPENQPASVVDQDFIAAANALFICEKEEEVADAFTKVHQPENSSAVLYLKARSDTYYEYGMEADDETKGIITSTDQSHYREWLKNSAGNLYRLEYCGILTNFLFDPDPNYIRKLERFCFIADRMIQGIKLKRTNQSQQDFLKEVINEAKLAAKNSNTYLTELFDKCENILRDYKDESQSLIKSIGLSEQQNAQWSEMHVDYTDEILALFSSREVYDQAYGNLLKILSKS